MAEQSFAAYVHGLLDEAGWPQLELSADTTELSLPEGKIVEKQGKNCCLFFWRFVQDTNSFVLAERYKALVYPADFDPRKLVYFRRSGAYRLSRERQIKRILDLDDKEVETIKLVSTKGFRRFYLKTKTLTVSTETFVSVAKESDRIYARSGKYGRSAENYLLRLAAADYTKLPVNRTTYVEAGEFAFLIDRLNLPTKRSKRDFEKYVVPSDVSSLEDLLDKLLKYEVFSESFLRRLNDYFIREHLREVIALGKTILTIGRNDLSSATAREVLARLDIEKVGQLETLWQRYFERYLLYLIFSYKQIFPKVELKDVQGAKKYPDFIGVNHYNGLDIIEIKTHLTKILQWDASHNNFYFSGEMSKAIIQTSNYLDSVMRERFKDAGDRRKITNFVDEENLYHPRGVIIISSRKNLSNKRGKDVELERDFTKLRNGLLNIEILTFDEVLDIPDDYITHIADSSVG